jgi:hypothetical protein
MACKHKFFYELKLEHLDYDPTTLIIGTFNPGWDHIGNTATWFYGRTHDKKGKQNNNFWDVLPQIYNEPSLINNNVNDWKDFCKRHRIAITDMISQVYGAIPSQQNDISVIRSFSDSKLIKRYNHFQLVDLVKILRRHSLVKNVYITRSINSGFNFHTLMLAKRYASKNGIRVQSILTPSGYARFQQLQYNKMNPNKTLSLPQYILMRWREVWHQID